MPIDDDVPVMDPLWTSESANEVMRPRLPAELRELLEAQITLIRANLLAERFDAAHAAIDRIAQEAKFCRPWLLPLNQRLALSPHELRLDHRVANQLERAELLTVDEILAAGRDRIMEIENFGNAYWGHLRDRIFRLFRHEARAGDTTGIFARLQAWANPPIEIPE